MLCWFSPYQALPWFCPWSCVCTSMRATLDALLFQLGAQVGKLFREHVPGVLGLGAQHDADFAVLGLHDHVQGGPARRAPAARLSCLVPWPRFLSTPDCTCSIIPGGHVLVHAGHGLAQGVQVLRLGLLRRLGGGGQVGLRVGARGLHANLAHERIEGLCAVGLALGQWRSLPPLASFLASLPSARPLDERRASVAAFSVLASASLPSVVGSGVLVRSSAVLACLALPWAAATWVARRAALVGGVSSSTRAAWPFSALASAVLPPSLAASSRARSRRSASARNAAGACVVVEAGVGPGAGGAAARGVGQGLFHRVEQVLGREGGAGKRPLKFRW